MADISKRAFPREKCETCIKYAACDTDNFVEAIMHNSSEGGMYFESARALRTGSEICIRRADYSPDIHGPEACDGYRAEVMWCRETEGGDGASSYGIGVRFIVNVCDKCGDKVSYSDIRRTPDFMFLCVGCLRQLEDMPGEKLRPSVTKYLIGNVL